MGVLKRIVDKILGGGPTYSDAQLRGLGYKSDGRGTREKLKGGKQRMLLDSTKLLLDRENEQKSNPYEAERRIDTNVFQMFTDESTGQSKRGR